MSKNTLTSCAIGFGVGLLFLVVCLGCNPSVHEVRQGTTVTDTTLPIVNGRVTLNEGETLVHEGAYRGNALSDSTPTLTTHLTTKEGKFVRYYVLQRSRDFTHKHSWWGLVREYPAPQEVK